MINRKVYTKYLIPLYIPIIIICVVLTLYYYPQLVYGVSFVLPVFLLLLIILFFVPQSKQPLGTANKNISNKTTWLLSWFALQIAVGIIFWGAMHAADKGLFFSATETMPSSIAFFNCFIQSGFYPWSLYLLLGIAFCQFTQQDKNSLAFRYALFPFCRNLLTGPIGVAIDLALKQGLLIAAALTGGVYLGELTKSFNLLFYLPTFEGVNLSVLFFSSVIYLLLATPIWQRFLQYIYQKNASPAVILNTVAIVSILIALLFGAIEKIFSYYYHVNAGPVNISYFNFSNPTALWNLFYLALATLWAPRMAKIISYLCQGYSLRSIIPINLILPVVVTLIGIIDQFFWHRTLANSLDTIALNFYFILTLFIIGFILTSLFFQDPQKIRLIHLANVSKKTTQATLPNLRSIAVLTTTIFLLYIFRGISLVTIFAGAMAIPAFLILLLTSLGVFYRCGLQSSQSNSHAQTP